MSFVYYYTPMQFTAHDVIFNFYTANVQRTHVLRVHEIIITHSVIESQFWYNIMYSSVYTRE